MDEKNDKLQIIIIEDELGDRIKRFSVSKKKLLGASIFAALFTVITTIYATGLSFKFVSFSSKTGKEIETLKKRVASLEAENSKLKTELTALQKEKEETIDELAKRVEIIDSLMKKVGIKVDETEGEGGLAIPIEQLFSNKDVDFSNVIPSIDSLIYNFKTVPLGYPTIGKLTSDFGLRRNPITRRLEFHLGVDIANKWGTPVRAPADGVVVKAGKCGLLGLCIEIRHNKEITTYYGHLAKLLVRRGDRVERGEIIGLMGNTGRSTGPHLHYAVKLGRKFINPISFMEVTKNVKEKGGTGGVFRN